MGNRPYPKVIENIYAVLINGDVKDTFERLAEARKMVKTMRITEDIKEVQIVKQCVTHTVLDVLKPELKPTLTFADLDWTGDKPS